jgi:hypothetical protein
MNAKMTPALAWTGVGVLVFLPLLLADIPPLLDYPNHLARAYIASHLASDANLSRFYVVNWGHIVPDMLGDAILVTLARILPIVVAGKVLIAAILAATLGGVACLHRVLWGRWSAWPLAATPFLWHGALTAGFVAFSLSLGLALLAASAWRVSLAWPLWRRLPLAMALGGGLWFSHLIALGIFLVICASLDLGEPLVEPSLRRLDPLGRRLAALAMLGAVPLALSLAFYVPQTHGLVAGADGLPPLGQWTLHDHLRGLMMPVMGHYHRVALAEGGGVVLVALLLWAGRAVRLAWPVVPAWLLLAALFLALPSDIMDTAFVPERFTIALALLAVAGSQPVPGRRMVGPAVACVGALIVMQCVSVAVAWHESRPYVAGMRKALALMPRGSRLLVAAPMLSAADPDPYGVRDPRAPGWYLALFDFPNLIHMPTLAVIDRSAFVHTVFVHPDKQILSFTPSVAAKWPPDSLPLSLDLTLGRLEEYPKMEYMAVLYADRLTAGEREALSALPTLYDDGHFMLTRVHHPVAELSSTY